MTTVNDLQDFLGLLRELGFQVRDDGDPGAVIEGACTVYIRSDGEEWHAYPDVDGYDEFGTVAEIRQPVLRWLFAGARCDP